MAPSSQSGEYSFDGLPGYMITLQNVPAGITPKLLPISEDEESRLYDLDRDTNIGLITSIAGNLVFYDEDEKEVSAFSSPIRLIYNFTPNDERKRKDRQTKLKNKEKGDRQVTVSLIPVFLYQHIPADKKEAGDTTPSTEIWQPFQNFVFDEQKLTVTIDFLFWGDRQVGGGTQP